MGIENYGWWGQYFAAIFRTPSLIALKISGRFEFDSHNILNHGFNIFKGVGVQYFAAKYLTLVQDIAYYFKSGCKIVKI